MTAPPTPVDELTRTFERMEETFEELARNWHAGPMGSHAPISSSVSVDLEDRDEKFVLTAELPGFDKDDIEVRMTDRTLDLEATHEEETTAEGEGDFLRRERHRSSVSRSIPLPEAVESDEISATYENGVLTVEMPKREPLGDGTEIDVA